MKKKKGGNTSRFDAGEKIYLGTAMSHGRRLEIKSITFRGDTIHIFGDESTSKEFVTYALVLIDAERISYLESEWSSVLQDYGSPDGRGFHCKKLFSGEARRKSVWSNLAEQATWELAEQLSRTIADSGALFYLGVVHRKTFPETIPDGTGSIIRIGDTQMYVLAYIAAMSAVQQDSILSMPIRKSLWVDQVDTTKIWGIGSIQMKKALAAFGIKPEPIASGRKPLLIEASDLVAYAAGRALDADSARNKEICLQVMRNLNVHITHYWWNPENTLNTDMIERLNRCSFLLRTS